MNEIEQAQSGRMQAQLEQRIRELAASYTPEWKFNTDNPDIGSVLALIFAGQMAENRRRMERLPEKYHTEFINLLGLGLKSARPAVGMVTAQLLQETVPGVRLPHNTRLMADSADGTPVLFETTHDVYLTNARLTDILSVSGKLGRIIPLRGALKPESMLEQAPSEEADNEPQEPAWSGVSLFDYTQPGVEHNALFLYHKSVFGIDRGQPLQIYLQTKNAEEDAKEFCSPERWRWSYYNGHRLEAFASAKASGSVITLERADEQAEIEPLAAPCHLICLEALGPVEHAVMIDDIRMASLHQKKAPAFILSDGQVLEAAQCMPFGQTVSVFDECYLCDDVVFSQREAQITLSFGLSSRTKHMELTAQQIADDLKIIKRKPTMVQYQSARTAPQRVIFEYYNGQGWRPLPCSHSWDKLFDGSHGGEYEISFLCPSDWAAVPIEGYEGKCMRIRVVQADDCYLLPCDHVMPVLHNVALSYRYEWPWKQPQSVKTVVGTQCTDQTKRFLEGHGLTAFRPLDQPPACLYLGFDRPMEGGPVSLWCDVEEQVRFRTCPVTFEYSTRHGFREMKVVDGTSDFAHSGQILFVPPSDFAPAKVEGMERWWIRILAGEEALSGFHPKLSEIRINAVTIENRQTHPEEEFYISAAVPNMSFTLSANNILYAEVFVSEMGRLSQEEMREMLLRRPEDVRVEYDFLGKISSFYIRWTEVESFVRSKADDRHYLLDRLNRRLIFGDGVHVRIPQVQTNGQPAILVRQVSCDGEAGNVPAGAIDRFYGNVLYVNSVTNPHAVYAGSDLEKIESIHRRGADFFSSRGRLVTQRDFVRAVEAYSSCIGKVKCLAGYAADGSPCPGAVTIVIMTKDYAQGAGAFYHLREPLRRELLERCEATLSPEQLVLTEPMYVEINVSVWGKAASQTNTFEMQDQIEQAIRRFLEPMESEGHRGWKIGQLPTEKQIKMVLYALNLSGQIERLLVVARYTDSQGAHEVTLDRLGALPCAIAVNGTHKVTIEF